MCLPNLTPNIPRVLENLCCSKVPTKNEKKIMQSAHNIESFSIKSESQDDNSVTYDEYLRLVKQCIIRCKQDPSKSQYYFIQHVKLDKDGKDGLTFEDYEGILKTVIKNNSYTKVKAFQIIDNCNYTKEDKKKLKEIISQSLPSSTEHSSSNRQQSYEPTWPGDCSFFGNLSYLC